MSPPLPEGDDCCCCNVLRPVRTGKVGLFVGVLLGCEVTGFLDGCRVGESDGCDVTGRFVGLSDGREVDGDTDGEELLGDTEGDEDVGTRLGL